MYLLVLEPAAIHIEDHLCLSVVGFGACRHSLLTTHLKAEHVHWDSAFLS